MSNTLHSISNYLTNNNVQLGATYGTSKKSAAAYDAGCKAAAQFINADPDEIGEAVPLVYYEGSEFDY